MSYYLAIFLNTALSSAFVLLAEGNQIQNYMQRFTLLMLVSFLGIVALWFLVWYRRRVKKK